MKISVPIVVLLAGVLLAGCSSSGVQENASASAGTVTASASASKKQQLHPNEAATFPGLFGTFYTIIPRETVDYKTSHAPGTIVVNTSQRYLYYVEGNGRAIRYNIGVGREGANWSGVSRVSEKREWPDWTPTENIRKRMPDVPRHMKGGPDNPLGARALYLGSTIYRIHGTSEPWRIGAAASAGCIRLSNDDIIDLYDRTRLGATVVVKH